MLIEDFIARWSRKLLWIVVAALLASTGCAKKESGPQDPGQIGVASWYGHRFDGGCRAGGESYDMEKLNAAHRTLPFGTVLSVENLSNSQKVEVRVNDRGPFVQGRIIDLSHAAAHALTIPGIANVRLQVISTPPTRAADLFAVQIQAFAQRAQAEQLREPMERKYGTARVVFRQGDPTWRLLVGLHPTLESANALAQQLDKEAGPAFVVLIDSD